MKPEDIADMIVTGLGAASPAIDAVSPAAGTALKWATAGLRLALGLYRAGKDPIVEIAVLEGAAADISAAKDRVRERAKRGGR